MRNTLIVLSALALVGCTGDEDDDVAQLPDVQIETGLKDTLDERIDAADGGLDADADAPNDADADAVTEAEAGPVYACAIMNVDSGATFGSESCDTCMSENCCDDMTGCFSYDDCAARVACVRACDGGATCKTACANDHFDAGTSLSAVSLCFNMSCHNKDAGCGTFP